MGNYNIKFRNQEESLQQQHDNKNNNNMVEEQVDNSRVNFGTLEDINRNNRGAMSKRS